MSAIIVCMHLRCFKTLMHCTKQWMIFNCKDDSQRKYVVSRIVMHFNFPHHASLQIFSVTLWLFNNPISKLWKAGNQFFMLYQHISWKKFHAQASFSLLSQITSEFSNEIYYPVFFFGNKMCCMKASRKNSWVGWFSSG